MTLDEAIRHAEEVAEYDCYNDEQKKCADEHRQLAEWLRELKRLRESATDADTISRRAAIDEAYEIIIDGQKFEVVQVETLMGLPSTHPEIIRCKDCRYGVDYYHEGDCYCSNPKWGLKYFGGSWEFYCADAERRTDG